MLQSVYFEQLPATSRKSQCWPCDMSSSSNHKGSKEKRRYEICPTPGCGRQAQSRGHCRVHDPQKGYICKHTGCSKACSRVGTYCRIHSTDKNSFPKMCQMPECSNQAHARGLCKRHDPSYEQCIKEHCRLQAKVASRGFCRKHDPMYKKCMKDNCNNQVQSRGFCTKHDPNWKKCKEDNCNCPVRARGRCRKHDKMYREKEKQYS